MGDNSTAKLQIIAASLNHIDWIISMANDQEWNPGLQDGLGFHTADPTVFFIGLLNGQPICCISAVRHDSMGDIGYYVVKEQYRSRGYGLKLFRHAMKHLQGCNIRLNSVMTAADKYKKSGQGYIMS